MPTGDNVLRDPIPNGLFDHAYRLRAFVTVPDFAGWRPEDRIQILGFQTVFPGDPEIPFSETIGVYLKANRIYGTHAATTGVEMIAGLRYCVETAVVINGLDGSIDQTLLVGGVEVGLVENADPNWDYVPYDREPPSAAQAGVSPSDNTQIAVLLGSPVWNTEPIGCGEAAEATGDPIYPGENGYPFLPGDDFYGEPYWPPDTLPLTVGMPGYPYPPEDSRYGDLYYPPPPEGTGSSGTVSVSVTKPVDGLVVSEDPLQIEVQTLELSATGGVPVVEIWVDSRRVGEAFGEPRIFFWEWFGTKPGAHQIRAVAKSTSGARVFSSPITVHIPDIEQPDIAFLSPPTTDPIAGIIEVAADAEDNVDVVDVAFYVDDTELLGVVTRPPYRVTLNTSDLTNGVHVLTALARDSSGNVAEATRSIEIGSLTLTPWSYGTMSVLPPPVSIEVDFENDPFIAPLSTAILGSQPWAYFPMEEAIPEDSVFTEDLTGLIHSGRLFGTWAADAGGGFRTTAMRTSGIVIPAPARRPAFTFGLLVRPRDFGESLPMRLLDTGGLRLVLAPDGSLAVEGAISTPPSLVPAGVPVSKHVALVYDADVPSVGTATATTLPGGASYMAILVDGEVVATKAPLSVSDTLMMAKSTDMEWVVGGGAGDVTLDEIALWMRPLDTSELQFILSTRDNPPTSSDTWTDVTQYVRGTIATARGKAGESEHAETGSMVLTLNNIDRRFEPGYVSSPYYPGVTTNRKIRMRANMAADPELDPPEWVDIWAGYVLRWPQEWGQRRSEVTIECAGNFVRFAHADSVSGDFSRELTGARLDRVLDAAAVPTDERALDAGKLMLTAHRVERSNARGYADQAVDSEFGVMFEDASGRIAFHDRDHRATDARSVVPQFVLGDAGPTSGELPLVSATPDQDEDRVLNIVRVEWPGGVTQVAIDGASVRKYGPKEIILQTLLASELSASRLARTILDLTSQPRWRHDAITIRPTRLAALWDVALRSEISDRLVVRRRPPGGGAMLELAVFIESVNHEIEIGQEGWITDWLTTFATTTVGRAEPVTMIPTNTIVVTLPTMRTVLVPTRSATAGRAAPFVRKAAPLAPAARATANSGPYGPYVYIY